MKGTTAFDLKQDGVSLATSGGFIDDIQSDIDKAKKEIVDGKIKVKDSPEEVTEPSAGPPAGRPSSGPGSRPERTRGPDPIGRIHRRNRPCGCAR